MSSTKTMYWTHPHDYQKESWQTNMFSATIPTGMENTCYLMLIKNLVVRTLVSGDKQLQITLESLNPEDIEALSKLSTKMEVGVVFINEYESSIKQ